MTTEKCANCGGIECQRTYTGSGVETLFCKRCGYYALYDFEKRVIRAEFGGKGMYAYKWKGNAWTKIGILRDKKPYEEWFKIFKKDLEVCRYTFKRRKMWYVKNLLTGRAEKYKEEK
jgi:hypothetical protein